MNKQYEHNRGYRVSRKFVINPPGHKPKTQTHSDRLSVKRKEALDAYEEMQAKSFEEEWWDE